MSSGSEAVLDRPPEDGLGRLVWRLDRLLRRPEDAFNFIAAMAIMLLMIMGVVQIVAGLRWLFNAPIFGYIDVIELSMPVLAIMGIAYCQRMGVHIRMDVLIQNFRGRLLWSVETFAAFCTCLIMLALTIYSYNFFLDAYQIGDSTTDAEISTWPSKLLVPIAFALMTVRAGVQILGALRLALDPDLQPVGVVVQRDIAEQAQAEIREAMVGEQTGQEPR